MGLAALGLLGPATDCGLWASEANGDAGRRHADDANPAAPRGRTATVKTFASGSRGSCKNILGLRAKTQGTEWSDSRAAGARARGSPRVGTSTDGADASRGPRV